MHEYAQLMEQAIAVCEKGIKMGESPFGAVIASRNGDVVCAAHNTVRSTRDATAHAEINAIREACRRLGSIDLSGHLIVSTCEPCPMCAGAIHWARLDAVVYGAAIEDAVRAGFHELSMPCRALYQWGHSAVRIHVGIMQSECKAMFDLWGQGPNAVPY